jgi:putative endonuclease
MATLPFNAPIQASGFDLLHPSWPGLSRPSTPCFNLRVKGGWVYFITNRRDGVLYVGVTSNLPRRAHEHREGLIDGFTKHHGLKRLVYVEHFSDIRYAIQREKTIKHWPRAWKVRLIHGVNPEWQDLYETLI